MFTRILPLLCLAGGVSAAEPLARAADWAALAGPSAESPRAVGGTSFGCLAGGVRLPFDGPGWQAIRTSRNRHWGHPDAIAFVEHLGGRVRAAGLPDLWIGDIAQPRGGPMPWGHASHQTGLDIDVWLDLRPKPRLPLAAREAVVIPSLVRPDETDVEPARWTSRHAALIRLAAEAPGVDRILVNHAIKRRLCRDHGGESWLRQVRPWRGHDSHMHVRLRCPAGSPDCLGPAPPPPGDGCDASLAWWLTAEARRPPPPSGPAPPAPRLPLACAAVMSAPAPNR